MSPILRSFVCLTITFCVHVGESSVSGTSEKQDYRVVCYYPNWSQYRAGIARYTVDQIDPWLCTHLVFAFAKIVGNDLATIEYNDVDMYSKITSLRDTNPSLKVLLSIGGATAVHSTWTTVSGTAQSRDEFSANILSYARRYGFDGVDLDWEFPGEPEKDQFTELCKALRDAFHNEATSKGKAELLLTSAMGPASSTITNGYDLPELAKYLDFANVMTYDLHGSWDGITGYHSALNGYQSWDTFCLSWVVSAYLSRGLPSHKLVLGIPTYGRTFVLCDPEDHGPRECSSGAGDPGQFTNNKGTRAYYEICKQIQSSDWTTSYDITQQASYAYSSTEWVSYETMESVKVKADSITNNTLGGAMFWDLSQDDFSNQCGDGNSPLIATVAMALNGKHVHDSTTTGTTQAMGTSSHSNQSLVTTTMTTTMTTPTTRYQYWPGFNSGTVNVGHMWGVLVMVVIMIEAS